MGLKHPSQFSELRTLLSHLRQAESAQLAFGGDNARGGRVARGEAGAVERVEARGQEPDHDGPVSVSARDWEHGGAVSAIGSRLRERKRGVLFFEGFFQCLHDSAVQEGFLKRRVYDLCCCGTARGSCSVTITDDFDHFWT